MKNENSKNEEKNEKILLLKQDLSNFRQKIFIKQWDVCDKQSENM
jgi:hypothetical protein